MVIKVVKARTEGMQFYLTSLVPYKGIKKIYKPTIYFSFFFFLRLILV